MPQRRFSFVLDALHHALRLIRRASCGHSQPIEKRLICFSIRFASVCINGCKPSLS